MKKFLITLLLLLPFGSVFADNTLAQLVIKQTNGEDYSIYFSEHPCIYFQGDLMIVSCLRVSIQYSLSKVSGYYFKDVMTDIELTEGNNIISQQGECIIANTGKAGDKISIFNSDGAIVLSSFTDSHGKAIISLRSLPSGVFVVNCPNNSFKILKQ